jgi:predicted RNA-binding protein with PIN domain
MQWLIDGHNLIGQMPTLHLDDPNDEAKLLEYLRRYRAKTGHGITVVFDSGLAYRPGETKKQGGITIQFASHGQTADQIIMQRVRRVKNSQAIMVVTSDRAIQQVAQQKGVRVLESAAFARQLLPRSSTQAGHDEGSRADIKLSPDEVNEWLTLFNQGDS